MLLDVRHVKLLNLRTPRVKGKLCFNPITDELRRQYQIEHSQFRELSRCCRDLVATLRALLQDWGSFLETRLYEEALIHHPWLALRSFGCLRSAAQPSPCCAAQLIVMLVEFRDRRVEFAAKFDNLLIELGDGLLRNQANAGFRIRP